VVSGWGEAVAGDPRDGKSVLGDVDVAYLQGSTWNRRVTLRAGRQFVFPGTAGNVQLDGLAPTLRVGAGFGLSGFVGVPVTPRFGYSRGEFTSGARVFWSRSYESEVGVSVLEILGAGRHVFRRDAGSMPAIESWIRSPSADWCGGASPRPAWLRPMRRPTGSPVATWT